MLNGHTKDNTFLVADFDRTITTGEPGCASAFGVFPRAPLPEHVSNIIREEAKKLFDYYYPKEIDTSIPEGEKLRIMKEWNDKVMELLGSYLNQEMFEEVLSFAESEIRIREGIKSFFLSLKEAGIPIIIFSAGVTNVIHRVLDVNGIPFDSIHSNNLGFVRGALRLTNNGVYIGNKGWDSLPEENRNLVRERSHKIILGDSLDDLNMRDPGRVSTSVGFLISEKSKDGQRELYQRGFDHVIESDFCDQGLLNKIQKTLI